jgi:hypothetical protein
MGSPFSVAVQGGPSTGASTASGASLLQATAGAAETFVITARDSSSNPTKITGTIVCCSIGLIVMRYSASVCWRICV